MACRDISGWSSEQKERFQRQQADLRQRKADQEWELAGLARQDGDREAERRHTERARALMRGED